MSSCGRYPLWDTAIFSCAELIAILNGFGVQVLVDIRAHPHSRSNPQFEQTTLRTALDAAGLEYQWAGRALGGLRRVSTNSRHLSLPESVRGYADHMLSTDFQRAAVQLIALARIRHVAVMCSERDPARCHRSLLADFLVMHGQPVAHLMAAGRWVSHRVSMHVRIESGVLIYDRHSQARLPGI